MQRDIGLYGGLLALGLGLAYWASLPTPEGDEEKVQIFALEPKAMTEIVYSSKDPKTSVEIVTTATKRDDDDRFWVFYTKTEPSQEPPKVDGGPKGDQLSDKNTKSDGQDVADKSASEKPAGEQGADKTPANVTSKAEPKVSKERFLAGEKLDDVVKGLNPLMAFRVIKDVKDDQLEEFGLKNSTQSFVVKSKNGSVLTLKLGRKSYGSSSRFAMEVLEGDKPGKVFLIDDQNFENLERAPVRLYDRRLLAFELDDVQKATITSEGKSPKRLAHTQRDKNGELLWTDDEEGAQAKPSNDSWMERLSKLRLISYGEEVDETRLASLKPVFEVTLEKDGKVVDTLRFKKETQDGKPVYWVTSDFLKVHGKVPPARLEPIEKDLSTVLASPKS